MSPPAKNEFEYYANILDRFQNLENPEVNLDVFISREIIQVLQEWKHPIINTAQEKKQMSNIVKNSIILLLALFKRDQTECFRNFNEFEEPEQKIIQKELLQLISV